MTIDNWIWGIFTNPWARKGSNPRIPLQKTHSVPGIWLRFTPVKRGNGHVCVCKIANSSKRLRLLGFPKRASWHSEEAKPFPSFPSWGVAGGFSKKRRGGGRVWVSPSGRQLASGSSGNVDVPWINADGSQMFADSRGPKMWTNQISSNSSHDELNVAISGVSQHRYHPQNVAQNQEHVTSLGYSQMGLAARWARMGL